MHCVTRWRPEEIIAGVSDLGIWPLLNGREGALLSLYPSLHAKYYRVDEHCLIGSANVTAKALGWAPQSNLELLVTLPAAHPTLTEFEARLLAGCSPVDQSVHDYMLEAVRLLRESNPQIAPDVQAAVASAAEEDAALNNPFPASQSEWLPTTRNPDDLYHAYIEQELMLSLESRRTAPADLAFFGVPQGLSRDGFKIYLGTLLLQQPIVRAVDAYVKTPRRFQEITTLLNSLPCSKSPDFDAARTLETLMRWMPHFLPNRYELRGASADVFARAKPNSGQVEQPIA